MGTWVLFLTKLLCSSRVLLRLLRLVARVPALLTLRARVPVTDGPGSALRRSWGSKGRGAGTASGTAARACTGRALGPWVLAGGSCRGIWDKQGS